MMEAIRKSPSGNSSYEKLQGNVALRKQIAKYAFDWGGNITENDVVTTQGCMEALVFLPAGDNPTQAIPWPLKVLLFLVFLM